MEQRDYLMRQVEQLGEVLKKLFSKLLNIKDSGTEAISTVNQHFAENLGFDIVWLCAIEDDKLIDALQNTMRFDHVNLEKLADLLLLVAENDLTHDRNLLLRKCLVIHRYLEYLEKNEKTYSLERNFKIKKIESLIDFTAG